MCKKQEIKEEISIEKINFVQEEIDQTKYRVIKTDSNIYPPQNKVVTV